MGALVEVGLWNAAAAAVLALAAAAVSRLARRPALAHTLWLLVLLKLVTPPLVPFSLPWPGGDETTPTAAADEGPGPAVDPADPPPLDGDFPPGEVLEEAPAAAATPPAPSPVPPTAEPLPWRWWAGWAWAAGSVLWLAWAAYHVARFRGVLRRARLAPGPLREEAEALARRLGLRRCPDVWLVPGAVSPMVWALGRRPCLLFPSGLLERLDAAGRAALLAHELAHVRRRDHWVRLLELAATALYWWLPVLWWARRELHEAEEQCCDAWGVWALDGDGRPYALALLQAVAFVSQARLPLPAGASGVGQVSHLKRRLAMVMQGKSSRSLSWAGLGGVFVLGLLLLPLFPALGQERDDPAPAVKKVPADTTPAQTREQQIQALKKALRALEEQNAEEAVGKERQVADTQLLRAQLKELEVAIEKRVKEIQDLQAKASALRAKLNEIDPKAQWGRFGTSPLPAPKSAQPSTKTPEGRSLAPLDESHRLPKSAQPSTKTPEGRVGDLEQKLERIQRELEELRRELKRRPLTPPGALKPPGENIPVPEVPQPPARAPLPLDAPVKPPQPGR